MLRATLFGELRVEVDGRPLPPLPSRPRALLGYLLLNRGLHPRTRLAGRFWPDVLETSARASLRSALWAVNGALEAVGGGHYLHADRSAVGLSPDHPRQIDVEEFSRLIGAGDGPSLERAAQIASGPLLADLADEWVLEAQDTYREHLVEALVKLAASAEAEGDPVAAIRWLRQAIGHERLRESLHRDLIRLLIDVGEPGDALATYRRLRTVLAAELGMRPSAETRALIDDLRAASAADAVTYEPPPVIGESLSPVVGRADARTALLEAWSAARSGIGSLVVVRGDGGIGKSTLVNELRHLASTEGATAVQGAVLVGLRGAPPLSPWSEAIGELTRLVTPAVGPWGADLARLSPTVESRWGCAPAPSLIAPDLEQARLFDAVVEAVRACSAAGPVLIVLEDVHGADETTLALAAHVGRQIAPHAVLMVLTARPEVRSDRVAAVAAAVAAAGVAVREIDLAPMPEAELHQVIAGVAPNLAADAVAAVVAACDANPLFAVLGARAVADGRAPADGARGLARAAMARLGPGARQLADAAAVARRGLDPAEFAVLVADEHRDSALAELEEMATLGRDARRRLGFVHEIVRDAWIAEMSPARRADAHLRVAETFARRPNRRAAEVATHFHEAGEPVMARRYLSIASDEAWALGAADQADHYLRDALGFVDGADGESIELWLKRAHLAAWRADRAGMDAAFDHALAGLEHAGDLPGIAAAHASRARWLHTTLCYPSEAMSAGRTALELIATCGLDAPEARTLALAGVAWAESVAGDPGRVADLIADAGPSTDPVIAAEFGQARATALIRQGALDEGIREAEGAALVARHAGRTDVATLALLLAASAHACQGDMDAVLGLCDRIGGWPSPGRSLELQVAAARAYALSRLGRHADAADVAVAAETLADGSTLAPIAAYDLGAVLLAAGRPMHAAAAFQRALDGDGAIPRVLARLGLAEALAASGDPVGAQQELSQTPFEPVGPQDAPDTLAARLARVQGLVAAAAGDHDGAARRFTEARAAWERRLPDAADGEAFASTLVDLGRPPVAGLVDVARELARLDAERAALSATTGSEV